MADRDDERDGEDKKGFLKRWSRLKLEEGERRPAAEAPAAEVPVAPAPTAEVLRADVAAADTVPGITETGAPAELETAEGTEAEPDEPFDPADLPDIDSLDKDSDYTGFLKEGVPAELRHMALQKLFRSDPALAVLDGLNDYDEDFTLAKVAEKIVSSYKPGRGYVDDVDDEDETGAIEEGDIETVENEDGDGADGDGEDTEVADAREKETRDETEKG